MAKPQLNPKIVKKLSEKLGVKENTVKEQISRLRQKYPSCTLNAVAQIYAISKASTVLQLLTPEDKATLPHIETRKEKITVKSKTNSKPSLKILIAYDTKDHFIKGHILEVNRAYTHRCYTAAYILLRKVIENLIVDILQAKYPPDQKAENKELYWDIQQRRFKDFSVILKNLYDKRSDFTPVRIKAIERLYDLAKNFKVQANDKTHSWFHLVTRPKELEDLQPQVMIELIRKIEV